MDFMEQFHTIVLLMSAAILLIGVVTKNAPALPVSFSDRGHVISFYSRYQQFFFRPQFNSCRCPSAYIVYWGF